MVHMWALKRAEQRGTVPSAGKMFLQLDSIRLASHTSVVSVLVFFGFCCVFRVPQVCQDVGIHRTSCAALRNIVQIMLGEEILLHSLDICIKRS